MKKPEVFEKSNSAVKHAVSNTRKQRSGNTDMKLVQSAKAGDQAAFGKLVMLYQQRLYYTVIRIVFSHEDANDIVQESFVKAYRNLQNFKEGYRFYTWLYRIAVNTALNHIQQKRQKEQSLNELSEKRGFNPESGRNLEEEYSRTELLGNVRDLLEKLPIEMRTVFTMRIYEEMSYQEIADTLEISIGTVMSRLHRARNFLKEQVARSGASLN